jgi:CRP/FNR family cyclic AMP-dependent transcriptional regulator
MDIDSKYLYSAGAEEKSYRSGEVIFAEGGQSSFYFQLVEGKVKLCNQNSDGKEFLQNIIVAGQCFGESHLFNKKEYPMDAVALEDCIILKLFKINFIGMLDMYPKLYEKFCSLLCDRTYYQSVMLHANSLLKPADRMVGLMGYLKSTETNQEKFSFKIPLTRQQMANLTGLCVETAIRALKKMEKENIVKIRHHKIFF